MEYRIVTDDSPSPSHLTPEYLKNYGAGKVFVETGTFRGDTVQLALDNGYSFVHSIELNKGLYDAAVERFKDDSRVKIWLGDSVDQLQIIVEQLTEPATFWLDAHASGPLAGGKTGGSPVIDELNIIDSSDIKSHTIFIDDRRLFGSAEWSYAAEDKAMALIQRINPEYKVLYLDGHIPADVICATVRS
jgi:hypothetical protein